MVRAHECCSVWAPPAREQPTVVIYSHNRRPPIQRIPGMLVCKWIQAAATYGESTPQKHLQKPVFFRSHKRPTRHADMPFACMLFADPLHACTPHAAAAYTWSTPTEKQTKKTNIKRETAKTVKESLAKKTLQHIVIVLKALLVLVRVGTTSTRM